MSATSRVGHRMPPDTGIPVCNLLRAAYPRHTAKLAAIAADVPAETSRNWVRGRATPSASTLLRMAARCDRMAAALERILHDRRVSRTAGADASTDGAGAAADRGAQA